MSINVRAMIDKETMTISSSRLVNLINENKKDDTPILSHNSFLATVDNEFSEAVVKELTKTELDFCGEFEYLVLPTVEACIMTGIYDKGLAVKVRKAFSDAKQEQKEVIDDGVFGVDSLLVVLSAYVKGINKRIEEQERFIARAKQAIEADKLELSNLTNQLKSIIE